MICKIMGAIFIIFVGASVSLFIVSTDLDRADVFSCAANCTKTDSGAPAGCYCNCHGECQAYLHVDKVQSYSGIIATIVVTAAAVGLIAAHPKNREPEDPEGMELLRAERGLRPAEPAKIVSCPVCLFAAPNTVFECGHVFCSACAGALVVPRLCPVCNAPAEKAFALFM
jgi:hypothetical protein